jgi:hypothetical protein
MDFAEIEIGKKYIYTHAGLRFVVRVVEKMNSTACVKLLDELTADGHASGFVDRMATIGEIWVEAEALHEM